MPGKSFQAHSLTTISSLIAGTPPPIEEILEDGPLHFEVPPMDDPVFTPPTSKPSKGLEPIQISMTELIRQAWNALLSTSKTLGLLSVSSRDSLCQTVALDILERVNEFEMRLLNFTHSMKSKTDTHSLLIMCIDADPYGADKGTSKGSIVIVTANSHQMAFSDVARQCSATMEKLGMQVHPLEMQIDEIWKMSLRLSTMLKEKRDLFQFEYDEASSKFSWLSMGQNDPHIQALRCNVQELEKAYTHQHQVFVHITDTRRMLASVVAKVGLLKRKADSVVPSKVAFSYAMMRDHIISIWDLREDPFGARRGGGDLITPISLRTQLHDP
ncbi:hypothetical protein IW261DRAFT_1426212 [Armillaria novae-zelandiae]|uniref:Uncharacterized protein n=1 Tax=Armillaria novae-zelandiae TaxID=153914 RepID=A0AA39TSB1_9AGAR|nr:hypothetical protein IW261DRAFT_1426212 [Armillaria novae-zelandiae]